MRLHGGPYDTRDVVESIFSEAVPRGTIEAAIEEIDQEGGPEWGPNSIRIFGEEEEEPDDAVAHPFSTAARHQFMLRKLQAVENDLDAAME